MCDCHKANARDEMLDVLKLIANDTAVDAEVRVRAATAVLYELKPKAQYYGVNGFNTHTIGGSFPVTVEHIQAIGEAMTNPVSMKA